MLNDPLLSSLTLLVLSLSFPETHNCCVYRVLPPSIFNSPFEESPTIVTLAPTLADLSIFADAFNPPSGQVLD